MEFYDARDLEYWKKQSEAGKAVLIEIPVSMLLDLDILTLNKDMQKKKAVSVDDLEKWMEENKEEIQKALDQEALQKREVEQLERNLHEKKDSRVQGSIEAMELGASKEQSPEPSATASVAKIMAEAAFSEEQIAIIAEAMLEELPDHYLLCFMKPEFSPEIMRKLKDYCTKMYREEMGRSEEKNKK